MKLLTPTVQINKKVKLLYKEDSLFETRLDFSTVFILENWKNCLIITIRLFGFGFTHRIDYE